MQSLDKIVSKAFDALSRAEGKLVTSVYSSKFAIRHPVAAGVIGGAGLAGAVAYLYSQVLPFGGRLEPNIYVLAIPVAVAGSGLMAYDRASQRREVSDAGLPVEKFYGLNKNNASQKAAAFFLAAALAGASNLYAYHSGLSVETLAKLDAALVPALYLAARSFTNALKPISSAASFKAAITEAFTSLASKATGNWQIHISSLESNARNLPSAQTKMELAEACLELGMLDKGLIHAKDAIEQKTDLIDTFAPQAGTKKLAVAARTHKAIRTGKANHSDYIEFSRSCHAIGETELAGKTIDEMAQKFPSIGSDILAAISLETYGRIEEAAAYWNSAVSAIFSKPELKVLPVSEQGVHNVRRYGPTPIIANTFIFKQAESYDEVKFAKYGNSLLRRLLGDQSYRTVPRLIADFAHGNGSTGYELAFLVLQGQSPVEMRHSGTLSHSQVVSIIEYLAWIHQNVSPETSRKGRVNLEGKLGQILENGHFALPAQIRERVKANISFIVEYQKESPYVFAKDPHPEQWRFGKDYLAALDWDDMGSTPLFIDSSKFYIHPRMPFGVDELDIFHGDAAVAYKKLFSNDSEFRKRLLSAMILQALSFASAWSVPQMKHMRGKRAAALEGASQAFSMIRMNHPAHYSSNRLSYDGLESDFKRAREILEAG